MSPAPPRCRGLAFAETAKVTQRLLAELPVIDLTVEDPPVEEVVERIFAQGHAHSERQTPSRETK
ncbi:MAG: hypothetical protein D6743_17775 [Calditrichaeota bacterium]|nr:MAG: hypothetical protein D6743_17775 [Calditrichota bacterium]